MKDRYKVASVNEECRLLCSYREWVVPAVRVYCARNWSCVHKTPVCSSTDTVQLGWHHAEYLFILRAQAFALEF